MINNLDSPHWIADPFQALDSGRVLCLWEGPGFFSPTDGLCDLQANDAEKLLLMWGKWRGQLWLDAVCPKYLPVTQEIEILRQSEHMSRKDSDHNCYYNPLFMPYCSFITLFIV